MSELNNLEGRVTKLEHEVHDHGVEIRLLGKMAEKNDHQNVEQTMLMKAFHKRLDDYGESRIDNHKLKETIDDAFKLHNDLTLAQRTKMALAWVAGIIGAIAVGAGTYWITHL